MSNNIVIATDKNTSERERYIVGWLVGVFLK